MGLPAPIMYWEQGHEWVFGDDIRFQARASAEAPHTTTCKDLCPILLHEISDSPDLVPAKLQLGIRLQQPGALRPTPAGDTLSACGRPGSRGWRLPREDEGISGQRAWQRGDVERASC